MLIKKLNESYFICFDCSQNDLEIISSRLKIKKDKMIFLSKKFNFYNENEIYRHYWKNLNNYIVIPYQAKELLKDIIQNYDEFNVKIDSEEVKNYFNQIKDFQPFETYDFQKKAIIGALINKKHFIQACTGSGKSVIISLIVKILIQKGLKGLLLVPNVSLVNQFDNDIKSYKLDIDRRLIGGDFKVKEYDKPLTISTWQSARLFKDSLKELDFIIVDEAHSIGGNEVFEIVNECLNAEYKIGLSGTFPDLPESKLSALVSFGFPKIYVRARDLIDQKLGTEIIINRLQLEYPDIINLTCNDKDSKTNTISKNRLESIEEYSTQLKNLLKSKERLNFLTDLAIKTNGNTVLLFDRVNYGLEIFNNICIKKKIPMPQNAYKNLTFQIENKIFFINGQINPEQREQIRKMVQNQEDYIICANIKIMSTGINIPNLQNLIFSCPIKAYITVTQSLGRLIRLHNSKKITNVYDIDDKIGFFKYQYKHRFNNSYLPEGYFIKERTIKL